MQQFSFRLKKLIIFFLIGHNWPQGKKALSKVGEKANNKNCLILTFKSSILKQWLVLIHLNQTDKQNFFLQKRRFFFTSLLRLLWLFYRPPFLFFVTFFVVTKTKKNEQSLNGVFFFFTFLILKEFVLNRKTKRSFFSCFSNLCWAETQQHRKLGQKANSYS